MSQAANTFWVNRVNASVKSHSMAKRRFRMHRVFDGVVLAVIIAACGICISYYLRTRAEFNAALSKNQAATEKLSGITSEVDRLERDVQRLRTDAKTFEELARHKFGFVRADDIVIKIAQSETGHRAEECGGLVVQRKDNRRFDFTFGMDRVAAQQQETREVLMIVLDAFAEHIHLIDGGGSTIGDGGGITRAAVF